MQSFVPDWLDPLRERLLPRLRDNSLTVDARTRLNIEAWLNAAQERTLLTDDPHSAQGALRSIVSKSARDQKVFDQVFESWCSDWKREEEAQDNPKVIDRPKKLKKDKPGEERTLWHQQFLALVAIVIGMIVVVWLIAHSVVQNGPDRGELNSKKELPAASSDIPTKIPDFEVVLPIEEGQTEVQLQTPPWLFGLHPLFYVLLVILLASAGFFTRYTRKTQLARIATREHLREQEVFVRQFLPVSGKRRAALRVAARLLRKPSPTESKVLDIHASTRATATRAGLFLPVYRIRMATPEYVWLVDRANSGDQLAHWAAEMARDLAAEGVALTLYEFDRDPRWVAPLHIYRSIRAAAPQRYVPLSSLMAGHLGQGMFILADGHDFIDPMRGELYDWLESAFLPWPRRVLMTPRPLASWGAVEDMLAGEGLSTHADSFLVLPAQIDSLAAAAKWLLGNGIPEISPLPGAPAVLPTMLQYDDTRWLGRDPPAANEMVMLVEQLRAYLGSTAYTWLAASAAYPHLSADLTAYLAQQLTDSPLLDVDAVIPSTDVRLLEARLVAIAQLPWCRQALMPDWLRRALLLSLPLGSRERVRQVLGNLLSTATGRNEIPGLSLGVIASENPDRTRKNLLQRFHRLILEIGLRSVIEDEPIESPLRDVIYLGVLCGDFESELTLDAPEEFARAAGAEMGSQLTLNPMRWLAAGMMIAVFPFLWFNWWARAQYQAARSKIKTDHVKAEEISTVQQFRNNDTHRNAMKGEELDDQSEEKQDTRATGALVYLSYDRTEAMIASSAAMALRDRLVRELGSDSVWDCMNFGMGEPVVDVLRQFIDNCVVMVAFMDRNGFANQRRSLEVSRALAEEKWVIPVLFDEARMPSAEELPIDVRAIADRHAFRLHTDERMHEDIAQLTEQIVRIVQNEAGSSKKTTRSASE